MKSLWLVLLLALNFMGPIHRVAHINRHTEQAAAAYADQRYVEAIAAYEYLLDTLQVKDDRVSLNLAQAYYAFGQTEKSQMLFQKLSRHSDPGIASKAYLQQGVVLSQQQEFTPALHAFRQALVRNPANEQARYNYEALKKYLLLHPDQAVEPDSETTLPPPPADPGGSGSPEPAGGPGGNASGGAGSEGRNHAPNSDNPPEPDQETQPDASPEPGEKEQISGQDAGETRGANPSGEPPRPDAPGQGGNEQVNEQDTRAQTINRNLEAVNLSPEKAQMLLDALNQAEVQHIQQLSRQNQKKPNPNKPDW